MQMKPKALIWVMHQSQYISWMETSGPICLGHAIRGDLRFWHLSHPAGSAISRILLKSEISYSIEGLNIFPSCIPLVDTYICFTWMTNSWTIQGEWSVTCGSWHLPAKSIFNGSNVRDLGRISTFSWRMKTFWKRTVMKLSMNGHGLFISYEYLPQLNKAGVGD